MTVMPWPVVPIKFCEHLKDKRPSQITSVMLRRLSCGGLLHHCAARAFEAMMFAAKTDGIVLKPTSVSDTYRSINTQRTGFLQRFQLEPIIGATVRHYDGKAWYLKKGMAVLASPVDDPVNCSRHMLGIAVDIANANGVILKWLIANEERFGFSHEVVKMPGAEPWHIRWTDSFLSPAVLAYEAMLPLSVA